MTKIGLLLGEGKSERYFFPGFLQKRGYVDLALKSTTNGFYQKDDVYWFFPFPPGSGKIKNQEGKTRLRNHEIYREAYYMLLNMAKALGLEEPFEVHLTIFFDTEGGDFSGCKTDIENALDHCKIPFATIHLQEVEPELEGWYAAGLQSDFPHFQKRLSEKELSDFLYPERSAGHSKEVFERHVDHTELVGKQDVALVVVQHFDEDKARKHSVTFDCLIQRLTELGLI
jgi:hypothetical protein